MVASRAALLRYHLISEAKFSTSASRQCVAEPVCTPWVTDPCSERELARCLCPRLHEEPADLTVSGFNLYESDRIVVIDEKDECTADVEARMSLVGVSLGEVDRCWNIYTPNTAELGSLYTG